MLSKEVKYRRHLNRWRRSRKLAAWRMKVLFAEIKKSLGYLPWERSDVSDWSWKVIEPTDEQKTHPDYREGHQIVEVRVVRCNRKPVEKEITQ